jgi:hypothetical protein
LKNPICSLWLVEVSQVSEVGVGFGIQCMWMVSERTPTLTLRAREPPSANHSAFWPQTRDLRDLRDLRSGKIQLVLRNVLSCFKASLTSPFYLTTSQRSTASENHTDLALTTEPDNLTELHQLSGLPTTHSSRRTESGFVVRDSRLFSCFALLARKTPHRLWIWNYGHNVDRLNDDGKPIKH